MENTASIISPDLDAPSRTGWFSSRRHALDFAFRAAGLRLRRRWRDAYGRWQGQVLASRLDPQAPLPTQVLGRHESRLWTQRDAAEWPLTAGKVHNLRVAAARLHGLQVAAGEIFSFWRAVGEPSRRRGFVAGRELREGCLVASTGGGLCQLTNALHAAALAAGAEVVERHPHSRRMPGSQAEAGRDATVFWNYLDLRFRLAQPFVVEVRLEHDRLRVALRGDDTPASAATGSPPATATATAAVAMRDEVRDCVGCTETACVHRSVVRPRQGRVAVLPAQGWAEFEAWLRARSLARPAQATMPWQARWHGLVARACRHRPAQRQQQLLAADDARATAWWRGLSHEVDELVVPVEVLAELQRRGALGGRRVSVLMTRSPLRMLHEQLDAASRLGAAAGLREFRCAASRIEAEWEALQQAARLVTPHHVVAGWLRRHAAAPVEQLAWASPGVSRPVARGETLLFPASILARKGAIELHEACAALDLPLAVLGQASDVSGFWQGLRRVPIDMGEPWQGIGAVVLPAWVEHAPRCLLAALARGLPVIATPECGLDPKTPGLRLVDPGDATALALALYESV